jgi:hypothetical protein
VTAYSVDGVHFVANNLTEQVLGKKYHPNSLERLLSTAQRKASQQQLQSLQQTVDYCTRTLMSKKSESEEKTKLYDETVSDLQRTYNSAEQLLSRIQAYERKYTKARRKAIRRIERAPSRTSVEQAYEEVAVTNTLIGRTRLHGDKLRRLSQRVYEDLALLRENRWNANVDK